MKLSVELWLCKVLMQITTCAIMLWLWYWASLCKECLHVTKGLDYVRYDIWSKTEQQTKVLYVFLFLWRTEIVLLHVRAVALLHIFVYDPPTPNRVEASNKS